jgi:hypothetical protein
MNMWDLAARMYIISTNDAIAELMEYQENKWKERVSVDWSQIKNRDIEELEKLSHKVLTYLS